MQPADAAFYGNSLRDWVAAIGIAAIVWTALWVIKTVVLRQISRLASKTSTQLDDLAIHILRGTRVFFIAVLAVSAGSQAIDLPETAERLIPKVVVLALLLQVALWGGRAIDFARKHYVRARLQEDPGAATAFGAVSFVVRLGLWVFILLLALDNLGIEITTLVAGLGIGGIAIALAVQNILGDLFASLSIALDKPFVIGDYVVIDQFMGTVEHVGVKTTRVRSLTGEQLIFSNADLLRSRIRNYKRMTERRILFSLGVTYQTPVEKLERIPGILRGIIESQELARFERAHFKAHGDFALQFEVVYWMTRPEFGAYMDVQQAINLAIHRAFAAEGIEFAYPTQTLFLERPAPPPTGAGDSF
ncbi:MAG: mechanosensitive ion channel family protein [Candidatus Eisenbacteria bacterium]|uniref:Mechanosensitive ion channel family protein n=1 Tax=Eiseniibacteriota bacterium TaxID=2212470 RepID=A0A937X6S1_UNCEI|nr:mechanosensitive ion channel family protein [Candidatus Eisenbacteria bacterium]